MTKRWECRLEAMTLAHKSGSLGQVDNGTVLKTKLRVDGRVHRAVLTQGFSEGRAYSYSNSSRTLNACMS